MSLQILLVKFPAYPARDVRKLARQLAYLGQINSKEAKQIADDLQELHVIKAQYEAQLNDDATTTLPKDPA
jgi:polyhydroxyalkanoate synthesis regulator phasin